MVHFDPAFLINKVFATDETGTVLRRDIVGNVLATPPIQDLMLPEWSKVVTRYKKLSNLSARCARAVIP
jgi:hypothetical protein